MKGKLIMSYIKKNPQIVTTIATYLASIIGVILSALGIGNLTPDINNLILLLCGVLLTVLTHHTAKTVSIKSTTTKTS